MAIAEHDQPIWRVENHFGTREYELCHTYLHRLHGELGLHKCEFYELNILARGRAVHEMDGVEYEAERGSIYLIPCGMRHGYRADGEAVIFHALIRQEFFEKYASELTKIKGYTLLFEIDPYLRGASNVSLPISLDAREYEMVAPTIDALLRNEQNRHADAETLKNIALLYLVSVLSAIISEKYRPRSRGSGENPNQIMVARSMEYMRLNVQEHLSIEDLAKHAYMARSTYTRNFTAVAGCSPIQFLTRCRMAQARKLLCYSSMYVTEISLACGFYDTPHFIHTFTRNEGVTPTDFRATHVNKTQYNLCSICSRRAIAES